MSNLRYNRDYFSHRGGQPMVQEELAFTQKCILALSLIFLGTSIGIQIKEAEASKQDYTISYEYVNIKDMTRANVSKKITPKDSFETLLETIVPLKNDDEKEGEVSTLKEVEFPATQNSTKKATEAGKRIWYMPTENGQISQYPNMGHVAYDITSWKGTGETVHPVANGVISGIYTDTYGALIVTVLHDIDGKKYTSQYVHLSSYAPGISVGQPVTINDALGQMGSTGWSTGVHLHLTVLDCALFDANDPNCKDLNGWYRYDKQRLSENFYGLGALVYVPPSWNSR